MSLPRACVNCERCFNLASEVINENLKSITDHSDVETLELLTSRYLPEESLPENSRKLVEYSVELRESLADNQEYINDAILQSERGKEVYTARNEAMKALESEQALAVSDTTMLVHPELRADNFSLVQRALQVCRSCSYDEPRIVKVVEEGKDYSSKKE